MGQQTVHRTLAKAVQSCLGSATWHQPYVASKARSAFSGRSNRNVPRRTALRESHVRASESRAGIHATDVRRRGIAYIARSKMFEVSCDLAPPRFHLGNQCACLSPGFFFQCATSTESGSVQPVSRCRAYLVGLVSDGVHCSTKGSFQPC